MIDARLRLLPPDRDACPVCAVAHAPDEPHDPASLYWGVAWVLAHGPGTAPTWADALAHCPVVIRRVWIDHLRARGVSIEEDRR